MYSSPVHMPWKEDSLLNLAQAASEIDSRLNSQTPGVKIDGSFLRQIYRKAQLAGWIPTELYVHRLLARLEQCDPALSGPVLHKTESKGSWQLHGQSIWADSPDETKLLDPRRFATLCNYILDAAVRLEMDDWNDQAANGEAPSHRLSVWASAADVMKFAVTASRPMQLGKRGFAGLSVGRMDIHAQEVTTEQDNRLQKKESRFGLVPVPFISPAAALAICSTLSLESDSNRLDLSFARTPLRRSVSTGNLAEKVTVIDPSLNQTPVLIELHGKGDFEEIDEDLESARSAYTNYMLHCAHFGLGSAYSPSISDGILELTVTAHRAPFSCGTVDIDSEPVDFVLLILLITSKAYTFEWAEMHGAEERQKASQTLQPDVGFLRMPPNCSSTLVLHEGTRLSLQSGNQKFADKELEITRSSSVQTGDLLGDPLRRQSAFRAAGNWTVVAKAQGVLRDTPSSSPHNSTPQPPWLAEAAKLLRLDVQGNRRLELLIKHYYPLDPVGEARVLAAIDKYASVWLSLAARASLPQALWAGPSPVDHCDPVRQTLRWYQANDMTAIAAEDPDLVATWREPVVLLLEGEHPLLHSLPPHLLALALADAVWSMGTAFEQLGFLHCDISSTNIRTCLTRGHSEAANSEQSMGKRACAWFSWLVLEESRKDRSTGHPAILLTQLDRLASAVSQSRPGCWFNLAALDDIQNSVCLADSHLASPDSRRTLVVPSLALNNLICPETEIRVPQAEHLEAVLPQGEQVALRARSAAQLFWPSHAYAAKRAQDEDGASTWCYHIREELESLLLVCLAVVTEQLFSQVRPLSTVDVLPPFVCLAEGVLENLSTTFSDKAAWLRRVCETTTLGTCVSIDKTDTLVAKSLPPGLSPTAELWWDAAVSLARLIDSWARTIRDVSGDTACADEGYRCSLYREIVLACLRSSLDLWPANEFCI